MSIKVSRILHAGYVFECGETQLLFDPIFETPFSHNCFAFPRVIFSIEQIRKLKPSAIFISHFHDDHCSLESLKHLPRTTPIYLFCIHEKLFELIRELGFQNLFSLKLDEPVQVGEFQVEALRALDEDVDSIFHIRASGVNILNVVDSWIGPQTFAKIQSVAKWDLVLWPFQTMREIEVLSPSRAKTDTPQLPMEWLEQIAELKPRTLVPSSCQFRFEEGSWYNRHFFPITYGHFEKEVLRVSPATAVVRMDPSFSIELTAERYKEISPLDWVTCEEPGVDYEYLPATPVPGTDIVAKTFAPLTEEQTNEVYDFCEQGLAQRFMELGGIDDRYFAKTRLWQLSVFDHLGSKRCFHFAVNRDRIELELELEREPKGPIGWQTEVPIARLYGALFEGESLSSMYVRINDRKFDEDTERELADVDLVHDPLLFCVFAGRLFSYQINQLKRIQSR